MLFILAVHVSEIRGQTQWTHYFFSPVLEVGPSGAWDAAWVEPMSVLYDGSQYRLWYLSYAWDGEFIGAGSVLLIDDTFYLWFYGQNSAIQKSGIGLATSSDGMHWTEYENNPVYIPNDPGDWDDAAAGVSPCVLFDGERYHLWYEATNGQAAPGSQQPMWQIGCAFSDDGIVWTA